jgi:hypothetical protein
MLAVSGFLMLSTGYLLVRMGIIVDEYGVDTLGSFWIGIGLWITALLSSILLFITYLFFAVQNKQKPFVVAVYVVASLAIFAFCMTSIVHTFSFQNEITKDPPPKVTTPKIIKISLTELDSIKTNKKSGIVYVSREDCPEYMDVYPKLEELLEELKLEEFSAEEHVELLYYDTINDRETVPEQVAEVLDKFGIDSVPTVVVVKGGEVQKAFDGDSIVQALKDYLAEQETKDAEADS